MMKKITTTIVAMVMVVASFGITVQAARVDDSQHEYYAKTTVVTEVDEESDTVYCVDFHGDEWSFTGIEDWMVGDYCAMVMDNMGTKIIYDDEIVSTTYTGWLNGTFGMNRDGNPIIEIYED